jgi:hypothetical protein
VGLLNGKTSRTYLSSKELGTSKFSIFRTSSWLSSPENLVEFPTLRKVKEF